MTRGRWVRNASPQPGGVTVQPDPTHLHLPVAPPDPAPTPAPTHHERTNHG